MTSGSSSLPEDKGVQHTRLWHSKAGSFYNEGRGKGGRREKRNYRGKYKRREGEGEGEGGEEGKKRGGGKEWTLRHVYMHERSNWGEGITTDARCLCTVDIKLVTRIFWEGKSYFNLSSNSTIKLLHCQNWPVILCWRVNSLVPYSRRLLR